MRSRPLFLLLTAIFACGLSRVAMAAQEIPFDFTDGFIVVHAAAGAKFQGNFLVDSGAAVSVLDRKVARKIGAKLGAAEPVLGAGSQTEAFQIAPVPLSINGQELTQAVYVMDLSRAGDLCSQPIHGLLGMDFFDGRVVQIDYQKRRLRLLAKTEQYDKSGATALPIRNAENVMCVPVSVNGSPNRWTRLDTGCNDALHWVVPASRKADRSRKSIGFVTDEASKSLTKVRLASQEISPVVTAIHGQELFPGEAGLLGNGLLSRHLVTIDTVGGWLMLQPVAAE